MVAVYTSTTQLSFSSESPTGLQSIRSMMKVLCDVEFLIIFLQFIYVLAFTQRAHHTGVDVTQTIKRQKNVKFSTAKQAWSISLGADRFRFVSLIVYKLQTIIYNDRDQFVVTEWPKKTKHLHYMGVMGENRGKLYAIGGYSNNIEFYNMTRWSELEGVSYTPQNSASISTPNGIYMASGATIFRFDNDELVNMGHLIRVKNKFLVF